METLNKAVEDNMPRKKPGRKSLDIEGKVALAVGRINATVERNFKDKASRIEELRSELHHLRARQIAAGRLAREQAEDYNPKAEETKAQVEYLGLVFTHIDNQIKALERN